jgi:hypothetical protein
MIMNKGNSIYYEYVLSLYQMNRQNVGPFVSAIPEYHVIRIGCQ